MGSDETSTSLLRRIGRRVGRRIGEELAMPPRRCEERYRHELKYLISYGQKADLNVRMAPLLDHDSHARDGSYTIRSLYFDDYWNTAYQEKVDGVLTRKKYRIFDRTLPTLPVLEPGKLVMEVKFTEFLPQIVRDILPGKAQEITAASKYVLCYDKASYLRGFDYWQEGWNVPSV